MIIKHLGRLFVMCVASIAILARGADELHQISITPSLGLTQINLEPILTSGLSQPLFVTNAHDGSNRLFIVEQPGRIKVFQPGKAAPSTFLDITSKILSGGEQGLLGLTFHPQYSANKRFFVDYTRQSDGATVVAARLYPADRRVHT